MANMFPADVADRLLDKLSSDDDFRAQFERNPCAAMKSIGFETPEADRDVKGADPLLCCNNIKTLASKEKIRAARAQLHEQLSQRIFSWSMAGLESD